MARRIFSILLVSVSMVLLASCYGGKHQETDGLKRQSFDKERMMDSLTYSSEHHYSFNYNFIVKADSLILVRQQPEEKILDLQTDSFTVVKDEQLVVADFRIIPTDSIDSVWVQVATVMSDFGWVHESQLLESVVPDDPISQFISTFSDKHLLIFIIIISIITSIYIIRKIARMNAHIVHFNDIDSFYPTLLTIIVASSATLYASIQNFAPDTWRHFYYHPTLNPFSVPLILTVFLMSVWALLIVGLTVVDVVRNHLPLGEALLYLGGLAGICAVDYIIFSITSLYYLGYVLLIAYIVFAIHQYYKHNHKYFLCGNCGGKIRKKGRCPHCGATNL